MNYWLLKSEPESFSIDDLAAAPKQTATWDGVRNFQARNMLRDSMKKGDQAFFYHSSCEVPGIAGIVSVVKEGYPDKTADDPSHHHYDDKNRGQGSSGEPRWYVVDVKLVRKFKHIIARATAGSPVQSAARPGGIATWESSVGDAGDEEGLAFRSLA